MDDESSTPTRASVLDVHVALRIFEAVRKGSKQGAAAKAGGVSRESLCRALARGRREPTSPYGAFGRAYYSAFADAARDRILAFQKKRRKKYNA